MIRIWGIAIFLAVAALAPGQSFDRVPLGFRHQPSKTAQKYLIEAMGAGVALFDFDSDGLLDIYLVNGAKLDDPMPRGGEAGKSEPQYWNRLFRNRGNWTFDDVTEAAGVAGRGYGMGVAVGDYDGDGDPDLLVTNFGPDILYRNEGDGTFRDVTSEAGLRAVGWSSGAAFLDYDRDGRLDLFVASYLDWDYSSNKTCGPFAPDRRSYCHPRLFKPVRHHLYLNRGGGRFEDVSETTGISGHPGKGLGVALGDYDDDGFVDIFVANDSYPQQLFRNIAGEKFEEVAVAAGVAYDADGKEYAGMGAVWADYDNDGRADLLVNALGRQGYWLYRNFGGEFEPVSGQSGLAAITALRSGWGMGLLDFDNDGWRDLFVAQGHVMDDISESDAALAYQEPLLLARNLFGRFYNVAARAGDIFKKPFAGRGAAFGDVDNDGLVDIVVNVNDGPALLLRNTTVEPGNRLAIRLDGPVAIGAKVTIRDKNGREQTAFQGNAGSYLASSSPVLHFGLGNAECCESVTVTWPDGATQTLREPKGPSLVIQRSTR